ncbi:MAG: M48 family metallopeptidase [Elusimicrobiales bacterium]|nr:M48 family metallopeptidase [Elusimicrobiales bacterium]
MSADFYLYLIITLLFGEYAFSIFIEYLNIKNLSSLLPSEFEGFYNGLKYQKSQEYLKENTGFEFISSSFMLAFTITFILVGGFNYLDVFSRNFGCGEVITGIIFSLTLKFLMDIIDLPFDIYDTFIIEKKYGFNKIKPMIFFTDFLKDWLLTILIGAPILAAIFYIFISLDKNAWLYVWFFIVTTQLILAFLSPIIIMPLFNKFTPLEPGKLKDEIENYAKKHNFKMKGIFVMDGSKRSSKTNAFFTGFGRFRRIVLYNTLIAKHTTQELVSILAHEMGHYKKKHMITFMGISFVSLGLMLFILSLFINNPHLFEAFKMDNLSVYAGIIFFGFIYSPISFVLGIFSNYLSRKHEKEADRYAIETYPKPFAMINALKKLTVENLSNLRPHPLKVFIHYSHPPALERINFIRALNVQNAELKESPPEIAA